MPHFNVIAEILVTRVYEVDAVSAEAAKEIVREDYPLIPYDIWEEDLQTIDVED